MSSLTLDLLWGIAVASVALLTLSALLIGSLVVNHRRFAVLQRTQVELLRESELRFRSLVENIQDAYYVCDGEGRIVYASPNLSTASGYLEPELLGQHFLRLVAPEDHRHVLDTYETQVRDGSVDVSCEFRLRTRTDTRIWVEQATRFLRNERGEVREYRNVVRDISERKQAEEMRRSLTTRILEAQESERKRIARELHDSVGQMLSSIQFQIDGVAAAFHGDTTQIKERVGKVRDLLDATIQEVRHIAHNLRPSTLDDLGLVAAVRALCSDFRQRTGIGVVADLPEGSQRYSPEIELGLYRIIQESMSNVEKHAHASRLRVAINHQSGTLRVVIADDGIGFDLAEVEQRPQRLRGLGLDSIRERAAAFGATVAVNSEINRGTQLSLVIPLNGTLKQMELCEFNTSIQPSVSPVAIPRRELTGVKASLRSFANFIRSEAFRWRAPVKQ